MVEQRGPRGRPAAEELRVTGGAAGGRVDGIQQR